MTKEMTVVMAMFVISVTDGGELNGPESGDDSHRQPPHALYLV